MTSTGEQTPSRLPGLAASGGGPTSMAGPSAPLPPDGARRGESAGQPSYPQYPQQAQYPQQPQYPQPLSYSERASYPPQAAGYPSAGEYPSADGFAPAGADFAAGAPPAEGVGSPGHPGSDPLAGYGGRQARLGGSRRNLRLGGLVAGSVLVLGVAGAVVAPRVFHASSEPGATGGASVPSAGPGRAGPTAEVEKGRVVGGEITPQLTHVVTNESKLTWAPPTLEAPTTVMVTPEHPNVHLEATRDYTVVLPKNDVVLKSGVSITGGHNVVIIGGVIHVPNKADVPGDDQRRGMYLKHQTGTVHIEGVRMTGDLSDGFNFDERDGAAVQIENVQIDLVHGSYDTHHADIIQTWAGPRVLRVDGLRAATQYQGLFLLPNQHSAEGAPPESFVFKRTVLSMMPGSAYAVWLPERNPPWLDFSGITVRLGGGMVVNKLSWPNSSLGLKTVNAEAAVDLPAGTPGGSYASPGYTQKPGY